MIILESGTEYLRTSTEEFNGSVDQINEARCASQGDTVQVQFLTRNKKHLSSIKQATYIKSKKKLWIYVNQMSVYNRGRSIMSESRQTWTGKFLCLKLAKILLSVRSVFKFEKWIFIIWIELPNCHYVFTNATSRTGSTDSLRHFWSLCLRDVNKDTQFIFFSKNYKISFLLYKFYLKTFKDFIFLNK